MFDLTETQYANETNRRRFFEEFAASKGFDPLIASNWYPVAKEDVKSLKVSFLISIHYYTSNNNNQGYHSVVKYYGSYIRALKALFPGVQFHGREFAFLKSRYSF